MNTDPISYDKSNKVEQVHYTRLSHTEFTTLTNASETPKDRAKKAKSLLDYLTAKYNIPQCALTITTRTRPCRGRGQLHGTYAPLTHTIKIYNTTAKTLKPISIGAFIDTLLHEFMHHYDHTYLKLHTSPHTAGFYKRISDLKAKLSS